MHDIKLIKNNPLIFDESLKKRNIKGCSKRLIDLYNEYLMFLNQKQDLQEKKNSLSKQFSSQKSNNDEIKRKVLEIKKKIDILNVNSEEKFKQLNDLLLRLPNVLSKKTPIGQKFGKLVEIHFINLSIKVFNFWELY